jgi:hypothetical protein
MTVRLTKQPVSLPRPLNVARPQIHANPGVVPQQGSRAKSALETIGNRNAPWNRETYGEKLERNRDIFETANGRRSGGHRNAPWNRETYGEKLERNREYFERVFGKPASAVGTGVRATAHVGVK